MLLMYYYCPNCQYEDTTTSKAMPKDLVIGPSDGFGNYIYYETCPRCQEKYAGYMRILRQDDICVNKARELVHRYYKLKV